MSRHKRPRGGAVQAPETDLIYGAHAVTSALDNPARRPVRLWATHNALERVQGAAKRANVPVEAVKPPELDRRLGPGAVHQGLLLETAPLPARNLGDLTGSGPLVVLDQISDPHNVGAILRSSAAFGAEALIMTQRHSPTTTGVLAKAASGALEHVPVIRVVNLARTLEEVADMGYMRIGLDGGADKALPSLLPHDKVALVLGAEGKGLRRLTRENCDVLANLATAGPISSLNVSNAAAVALYILSSAAHKPGDS